MRLRIILFILLACWAVLLPAQQSDAVQRLQTFARNINSFSNLYPQEKVYLHFDNTGYYIGETMWFQSYVVSAQTLQPA
ncbi:MAG: hypothetical protein LBS09_04105, partial [Bacteroidales bacterium]|nr:hypothetical protein [Bacteroidales bacterium]